MLITKKLGVFLVWSLGMAPISFLLAQQTDAINFADHVAPIIYDKRLSIMSGIFFPAIFMSMYTSSAYFIFKSVE